MDHTWDDSVVTKEPTYTCSCAVPARMMSVEAGGLTVWYNGMSYVLQVLSSSTDADLINVCKALYAYSQAANAHFK